MARRKLRKTRISVWPRLLKVWPIFIWRHCQICDDMVRREWIWRYLESETRDSYNGIKRLFICSKCCPTIDDAAKYLGITICQLPLPEGRGL